MLSSTGKRLTCAGFTQTLKHAMKRRRLTSLLGAATLALGSAGPCIALGAGAGKGVRRIGWLSLDKAESDLALQGRRLLYESMRRAGYDERANLIVYLNAQGSNLPLPAAPAAAAAPAEGAAAEVAEAKPAEGAAPAAAPAEAAK